MSDKILLKNMMFYGFHGVYEYEREQGQRFYIDVELHTDAAVPGETDNLKQAIDYSIVYGQIKEIVENHRFQLLEALGTRIANMLLANWNAVTAVTVRLRKPAVPIPGPIDYVQVEINRSRGKN
ncbi:MAG: dihydroneopterin aldolase [Veillonellales bacterium]